MTDDEQYILDVIRTHVWSGFSTADEVQWVVNDLLEDDELPETIDESMLRNSVSVEFARKAAAEATWPAETDCDRLDQVFEELRTTGIIAIQNAGYTMSDGHDEVGQVLKGSRPGEYRGYCFYHGQDLERAVDGGGLMLAFADLCDDRTQKWAIGHLIKVALERRSFVVEWNGDPETRLSLPYIDWKRRGAAPS